MSESGVRERLAGCWRLVDYSVTAVEGGETEHPLGNNPVGTILYTPDGYMSAPAGQAGTPVRRPEAGRVLHRVLRPL